MRFFNPQQFFSPDDGSGAGSDDNFSADMAVLNEPSEEPPAPTGEQPSTEDLGAVEEEEDEDDEVEEDEDGEGDETDETEDTEETDEADAPVQGSIATGFPGQG